MKVKDLMADLARMDAEADVYVRVDGRQDNSPPPNIVLQRGYYHIDRIKPGAVHGGDVSILLDER